MQPSRNLFYALCHQGSLTELDSDWIQVSTLQAPVFDDNRHHCSYNYRRLGPLSSIQSCPTPLHPNHFNHAREVLAIDPLLSESTPEVMALAHSFTYMGLNLETHFIIMFEPVSSLSIFTPYPIIGGLGEGGTQPTSTGMYCLHSDRCSVDACYEQIGPLFLLHYPLPFQKMVVNLMIPLLPRPEAKILSSFQ